MFESCHKCTTKRHPGCHATCKEYKEAREKYDKMQEEKKAEHDVRIYMHVCAKKHMNKQATTDKKEIHIMRNIH